MKTFENFIESEAFFPVLILLLVMLVCVFVWVILSNTKEEKKRRNKKNVKIDEDAEIKIVSDGNEDLRVHKFPVKEEQINDEPERSEIAIVEEVKGTTPFVNFNINKPKDEEVIYDIPLPNFNENRFTEVPVEPEIDYSQIDYGDLSAPPVPEIFKEEGTFEVNKDGNLEVNNYNNNNGNLNSISEDVSNVNKENENVNAANDENINPFNSTPTEDTTINEDIKVEEVHEYVGEKTEVFDFPAFDDDDIFSSGDIESEIINAAENYIKDVMSK